MDKLVGQVQAVRPVGHQTPHETVDVERSPADAKNHNQCDCKDREERAELICIVTSPLEFVSPAHYPPILEEQAGEPGSGGPHI